MKNMLLFFVFYIVFDGVFGESVLVLEGDAVTLHTDLTEIEKDDVLEWRFGAKGVLIAQINRGANKSYIDDEALNQRFNGRLKLDNQTGDLTIRNIRTEHSGLYEGTSRHTLNKIFNVSALPVDAVKSVTVMVGDSFTLNADLTEIQRDDVIQWRFEHQNSPIAEINRKNRNISKYGGPDERFKHRLQLDYWSGSLTIRKIRTEHSGLYEVDIISSSGHTIHKSFNVTVSGEMRTVSVMEGDSMTLDTSLTEIQRDDFITWMFGDTVIAEIYKNRSSLTQQFYTYDGNDERFRDRLQLNNQTGSLTITKCKASNSGLYELQINRHAVHLRFTVTVSVPGLSSGKIAGIAVSVVLLVFAAVGICYCHKIPKLKHTDAVMPLSLTKGEDVTLNTDAELQTDDQILWMFEDENSPTAEIKRGEISIYDVPDGRFRERLMLDKKTGSLTITSIRKEHAGDYQLKIRRSGKTFSTERFSVSVFDEIKPVSVIEGESVTLNTDTKLQTDNVILWMFGDKDTVIAETKEGSRGTTTHHGPDGRFRGRLKLDHQTGSLTIMNIRNTDSGHYKLQNNRSGETSFKLFNVSVTGDPTALGSMPEETFFLQPGLCRQRSISTESYS